MAASVSEVPVGGSGKPLPDDGRPEELGTLYRLTDRLYRASTSEEVFAAGLDAITAGLDCERASVLLFDDAGVMRFVAWRGLSDDYRNELTGHSPWTPSDRDPEPIFVSDIVETEEPDWVKHWIELEGIRALGFIPLTVNRVVVGKFMTYYQSPRIFTDHERSFAVTIARQLGFAIERLRADHNRRLIEATLRESEQRFRVMSEHAPVMIWMSNPDGSCLHLNRMLREFWGVEPEAVAEFDWQPTIHPDDAVEITCTMGAAIQEQRPVSLVGRYRDRHGDYRYLQTQARPRFSAQGEFLGMVGVNVDVSEREELERVLRESEERFRLAVEAAPSGMLLTDANGAISLVNAAAENLFGYERDELLGQSVEVLVPQATATSHPGLRQSYALRPTARPMGAGRDLFARCKDGTEIPVEIGLSPIATKDGMMTLASVVDIRERKRAERQRDLLVDELNHRVKNTLAVVQGLAHQTFRGSETSERARAAFEGRLVALAAAHNLLTQSDWQSAPLEKLALQASQLSVASTQRIRIAGPSVLLPPKHAVAFALALHELATNAVKYGALSNDSGSVELSWWRDGQLLLLTWQESGGPRVVEPDHPGFGTRLLQRSLRDDLEGEVRMEFRPEGLLCRISTSLPARN